MLYLVGLWDQRFNRYLHDTAKLPRRPFYRGRAAKENHRVTHAYECWNQRFQAIENLLTAIMSPGIKH